MIHEMIQGLGIVIFFVLIWGMGTFVQYRYWRRVRLLIRDIARDHIGCLGTGMCKTRFSRRAFVLLLTDTEGTITNALEIRTLSLHPSFEEMPGLVGVPVEEAYAHMPNERYHGAFDQAISAIKRSKENSVATGGVQRKY